MSRAKPKKPVRYYKPKRRAIYARGDEIDALTLFDLFGWTCIICKEPIDHRKRCPDWKAATIEHIVPLSKGGTHTWDNVAPAHYKCNMEKGDLSCDEMAVILNT
jgi:5-methylcytosine-specific restriction endonuclease McrA